MAEPLNRIGRRHAATSLLFVAAAFANGLAAAQVDPTRPPDVPVAGHAGAAAEPVLKSILISNERTEAIIGEKVVRAGEKVGNAYVVKILESEVILRDEHGLQTLKLFPGIEKRYVAGDNNVTGAVRNNKDKSKK